MVKKKQNGVRTAGSVSPLRRRPGKASVRLHSRSSSSLRPSETPVGNYQREQPLTNSSMALSKAETVVLSSAGDVLVCRCKHSTYPQHSSFYEGWNNFDNWQDDLAIVCCDANCDDLTTQVQDAGLCGPWTPGNNGNRRAKKSIAAGGLLGGSPADVATPLQGDTFQGSGGFYGDQRESHEVADSTFANRAQRAFRSPPIEELGTAFDEESIVPIRSFDYSHFKEGGNDMVPDRTGANHVSRNTPEAHKVREKPEESTPESPVTENRGTAPSQFIHGVPTFLSTFAQVKVTQVSAHPLGSHVLLISAAGLLYSYGLNEHGQLGIGLRTHVSGFHRGYIMAPTIVTPLVENGGKAIACAAGVSHSLVVVMTEERRLTKSRSFDSASALNHPINYRQKEDIAGSTEAIVHHQLYGFGRNDFMKIGLVSPKLAKAGSEDEMESVVLPRRVALRCKVRPEGNWVHNWSSPSSPAPPAQGIFAIAASSEHSAALVRRASGDVELYTWGNAMKGALGLPQPMAGLDGLAGQVNMSPAVRVVPVPSFVATLSRTSNPDARSTSLLLWDEGEHPVNITLGRNSSFVVTSLGRCFSFGMSEEGMLGLGEDVTEAPQPSEICLPRDSRGEAIGSISAGASHVVATTCSGRVYAWGCRTHAGLGGTSASEDDQANVAWSPQPVALQRESEDNGRTESDRPMRIVQACAGYDSTVLVAESGRVLSCGKNSGRLGLGELSDDVQTPRSLFGGLHLWQRRRKLCLTAQEAQAPKKPAKHYLTRGTTLG